MELFAYTYVGSQERLPGFRLQPLVVGPDAIPIVRDEQAARQDIELAVLSAMAHGHEEEVGAAIAQAVMNAARGVEDERFSFYVDLAVSSLGEAARRALEALMKPAGYEYQTDFIRKWVFEGRREGEMAALFEVLDARGLAVDDAARQQITACTDLAQLKSWLRKAATARSVQELFVDRPAGG